MNIYIALAHNGSPLGLLLAESMDYAQVAFEAMNTQHNNIEEIVLPINIDGPKVFYLLTSTVSDCGNCDNRRWVRGK